MQKPQGLKLRNGVWHVHKSVRIGGQRIVIQRSTGLDQAQIEGAVTLLNRWIAEATDELLRGPKRQEHTFAEAAVQYVLAIERKGKNPERTVNDINLVHDYIGDLPLSHVHQGALVTFERDQKGVRRSSTIARVIRTVIAILNHAARVLRDGNDP